MGATSADYSNSNNDTQDYERVEAGVYPGRCIQVVELGTHTKTVFDKKKGANVEKDIKEIMIVWEISELMQDGLPFVVNLRVTNSLNEKANLCKHLESWRGQKFTEEEKKRFDMGNILDKCCMLNVSKTQAKNERWYNNVVTIMPLPKGMACIDRVNELVNFGIDDINTPEFDKLWPWVQSLVKSSHEAQVNRKPQDQPGDQSQDGLAF